MNPQTSLRDAKSLAALASTCKSLRILLFPRLFSSAGVKAEAGMDYSPAKQALELIGQCEVLRQHTRRLRIELPGREPELRGGCRGARCYRSRGFRRALVSRVWELQRNIKHEVREIRQKIRPPPPPPPKPDHSLRLPCMESILTNLCALEKLQSLTISWSQSSEHDSISDLVTVCENTSTRLPSVRSL